MLTGMGPLELDLSKPVVKVGRERDGRICVCGHGARNHGIVEPEHRGKALEEAPQGSVACSVGRHHCACERFFPVLVSQDNRRFMSKTVGPGTEHALARGVANALNAGVAIRWAESLACGKCEAVGVRLQPVAVRVGLNGPVIARRTSEYNYLLCDACFSELPIEVDPETLSNVSAPGNRF